MQFEIKNIEPMGAVRTTRRGKYMSASTSHHYKSMQKYFDYKKIIYYEVLKQLDNTYDPIDAAVSISITFKMPIPASWSVKKKNEAVGTYHTKKPDIDNLAKSLFDSLNGLIFVDDNRVAKMEVTKIYSVEPGIVFDVESIGGLANGQAATTKTKEKTKQIRKRKTAGGTGRNIRSRLQ